MTEPVVAILAQLTPAAVEGWHLLFDLAEADSNNWVLVGGQMVHLLAVEHAVQPVRATDDVDVVVNVRTKAGVTAWLAGWLVARGFSMASVSATGIGYCFVRSADPGPGRVVMDIMAPEGIGERANAYTRRPAHTVEAPGGTQALDRANLVTVTVDDALHGLSRTGRVRRPNVLGALVIKAATAAITRAPSRARACRLAAPRGRCWPTGPGRARISHRHLTRPPVDGKRGGRLTAWSKNGGPPAKDESKPQQCRSERSYLTEPDPCSRRSVACAEGVSRGSACGTSTAEPGANYEDRIRALCR